MSGKVISSVVCTKTQLKGLRHVKGLICASASNLQTLISFSVQLRMRKCHRREAPGPFMCSAFLQLHIN